MDLVIWSVWREMTHTHTHLQSLLKYNRIPLILINWDGQPSRYAQNLDNWIVLLTKATMAVCSEKAFLTYGCFRLHVYLHTNKTFIHNSIYVVDNWGKNWSHNNMQYKYSKETFTWRAKPIQITSVQINGILL